MIISIWIIYLISFNSQIYIINQLGGVANYVGNIEFRVEYFKGSGYIIDLINLIAIINVL